VAGLQETYTTRSNSGSSASVAASRPARGGSTWRPHGSAIWGGSTHTRGQWGASGGQCAGGSTPGKLVCWAPARDACHTYPASFPSTLLVCCPGPRLRPEAEPGAGRPARAPGAPHTSRHTRGSRMPVLPGAARARMVLKRSAARSTPAARRRSNARSPRQAVPNSSAVSRAMATLPAPLAAKLATAAATAVLDTSVASTRLRGRAAWCDTARQQDARRTPSRASSVHGAAPRGPGPWCEGVRTRGYC